MKRVGFVLVAFASAVSMSALACPDQAKGDPSKMGAVQEPTTVAATDKTIAPATPVRFDAVDSRVLEKATQSEKKSPLPADAGLEKPTKSR